MSYRFQNKTIKGSSIGREYTAQGLQKRKGVEYDAGRDHSTLRRALEKAGIQRLEPSGDRSHSPGTRENRLRDREGGLSPDQKALLAQVGRFRTVKAEDVIQHQYGGSFSQFQQDIRAVSERGLAERRTVQHAKSGQDYKVIVLTQQGRNYLRKAEKREAGECAEAAVPCRFREARRSET